MSSAKNPGYAISDSTGAIVHLQPAPTGPRISRSRKIRPTRGDYHQGRCAVVLSGSGGGGNNNPPYISVEFESGLERSLIRWISTAAGLVNLTAQPLTIAGYDDAGRVVYTPDYLAEFKSLSAVPPQLQAMGFEEATLIEVKPSKAIDNRVIRKIEVARRYTGLPVVLITERELATPIANRGLHHVQ